MSITEITIEKAIEIYEREDKTLVINDGEVKGIRRDSERGVEVWTYLQ